MNNFGWNIVMYIVLFDIEILLVLNIREMLKFWFVF